MRLTSFCIGIAFGALIGMAGLLLSQYANRSAQVPTNRNDLDRIRWENNVDSRLAKLEAKTK